MPDKKNKYLVGLEHTVKNPIKIPSGSLSIMFFLLLSIFALSLSTQAAAAPYDDVTIVAVSQQGYHPFQSKQVVVYTSMTAGSFALKDAQTGASVMTADLMRPKDADGNSVSCQGGLSCLVGDFSSLQTEGRYYIETFGKRSAVFVIEKDVFKDSASIMLEFYNAMLQQNSAYHEDIHLGYDPGFTAMADGSFIMHADQAALPLIRLAGAYSKNPAMFDTDNYDITAQGKSDMLEYILVYVDYLEGLQGLEIREDAQGPLRLNPSVKITNVFVPGPTNLTSLDVYVPGNPPRYLQTAQVVSLCGADDGSAAWDKCISDAAAYYKCQIDEPCLNLTYEEKRGSVISHNSGYGVSSGWGYEFGCYIDMDPSKPAFNGKPNPCMIFYPSTSREYTSMTLLAFAKSITPLRDYSIQVSDDLLERSILTYDYIKDNYDPFDPGDEDSGFFGAALFLLYDATGDENYLREAHSMRSIVRQELISDRTRAEEFYWEEYVLHKDAIESAGLQYAVGGVDPATIFTRKIAFDYAQRDNPISGNGEHVYELSDDIQFQNSRFMLLEGIYASKADALDNSSAPYILSVADSQISWLTGMNAVQQGTSLNASLSSISFIFGIGAHPKEFHSRYLADSGYSSASRGTIIGARGTGYLFKPSDLTRSNGSINRTIDPDNISMINSVDSVDSIIESQTIGDEDSSEQKDNISGNRIKTAVDKIIKSIDNPVDGDDGSDDSKTSSTITGPAQGPMTDETSYSVHSILPALPAMQSGPDIAPAYLLFDSYDPSDSPMYDAAINIAKNIPDENVQESYIRTISGGPDDAQSSSASENVIIIKPEEKKIDRPDSILEDDSGSSEAENDDNSYPAKKIKNLRNQIIIADSESDNVSDGSTNKTSNRTIIRIIGPDAAKEGIDDPVQDNTSDLMMVQGIIDYSAMAVDSESPQGYEYLDGRSDIMGSVLGAIGNEWRNEKKLDIFKEERGFVNGKSYIPGWINGAYDTAYDDDAIFNYDDNIDTYEFTETTNEMNALALELYAQLDMIYNNKTGNVNISGNNTGSNNTKIIYNSTNLNKVPPGTGAEYMMLETQDAIFEIRLNATASNITWYIDGMMEKTEAGRNASILRWNPGILWTADNKLTNIRVTTGSDEHIFKVSVRNVINPFFSSIDGSADVVGSADTQLHIFTENSVANFSSMNATIYNARSGSNTTYTLQNFTFVSDTDWRVNSMDIAYGDNYLVQISAYDNKTKNISVYLVPTQKVGHYRTPPDSGGGGGGGGSGGGGSSGDGNTTGSSPELVYVKFEHDILDVNGSQTITLDAKNFDGGITAAYAELMTPENKTVSIALERISGSNEYGTWSAPMDDLKVGKYVLASILLRSNGQDHSFRITNRSFYVQSEESSKQFSIIYAFLSKNVVNNGTMVYFTLDVADSSGIENVSAQISTNRDEDLIIDLELISGTPKYGTWSGAFNASEPDTTYTVRSVKMVGVNGSFEQTIDNRSVYVRAVTGQAGNSSDSGAAFLSGEYFSQISKRPLFPVILALLVVSVVAIGTFVAYLARNGKTKSSRNSIGRDGKNARNKP